MSVTARFYVSSVQKFAYNPDHLQVTMQAVSRGEENKAWAAATPAGEIKMTINNPAAARFFEERLGKDVVMKFEDGGDSQHPTPYSP